MTNPAVAVSFGYPAGQTSANPGDAVTATVTVTGANTTPKSFPVSGSGEDDVTGETADFTGQLTINLPNLLSGSISGQTSQGAATSWQLQSSKQVGSVLTNIYQATA